MHPSIRFFKRLAWLSKIMCGSFFLVQLICPGVSAIERTQELASFKTGYFYASVSRGEGIVQVSDCKDLKTVAQATHNKPFSCARDDGGFRCTTPESLDVIFLFKDKKECEADRTKTLSSDEE